MQQRRKPATIQPKVRLPEDLHKKLWRAAQKGGRTLNSEMVRRLEHSFELDIAEVILAQAHEMLRQAQQYGPREEMIIRSGPLTVRSGRPGKDKK